MTELAATPESRPIPSSAAAPVHPTTVTSGADTGADREMQRFRERVAAAIALIVIGGSVALMIVAVMQIDSPRFERVKDLLLFINPLLGVVIGYYFSKVTTEARAEKAESAAGTAQAAAQREAAARQEATTQADQSRERAQEAQATLAEVAQAAERVLGQPAAPRPGVLGGESAGAATASESGMEARLELEAALRRARRLVP